ncbi:MAG: hypothetical protein S0880_12595 [Actinomycetota bacterium]|nr:hypothetical protein [Actinomycetota bacterium]
MTNTIGRASRRLHRRAPGLVVLVTVMALLAACGGSGDDTPVAAPEPTVGAQLGSAATELGDVLVDPLGRTVYAFTDDADGTSTCYDACAEAWPPVAGDLAVADALAPLGFDTVARDDGAGQLRIGGRWPLYTFAGDTGPGDIGGQASGGVWFAVGVDGALIGIDGADAGDAAAGDGAGEVVEPGEGDEAPGAGAADSDLLTDTDGLTAYIFTNDTDGTSTCFEPCSTTWPPIDPGELAPGADIDPGRLSAIQRPDGTAQVTLDGLPLYRFKDDLAPGDVNGQGVGDVWFLVEADGDVRYPPALRLGSTDAGNVLIDGDGFTLYHFADDPFGASICNDACAQTWIPVPADAPLDPSLDPTQFGRFLRQDGSRQLMFDAKGLYRYSGDENPGDANGVLVQPEGTWTPVAAEHVDLVEVAADAAAVAPVPAAPGQVSTIETSLGTVLADPLGLTLYGFVPDSATEATCLDGCAQTWPPVRVDVTVADIAADTSGIIRADGVGQLVIGAWPAYTFSGDAAPGDVNGQGSGGNWFAIAPDGSLVGR